MPRYSALFYKPTVCFVYFEYAIYMMFLKIWSFNEVCFLVMNLCVGVWCVGVIRELSVRAQSE